ncbi:MAG: integration host factor subunit alpha [Proteobacteria bacterium]|nr:integration host factor subunit alpha [Pseudomonadota bacterium]MBU1709463.1 integration host factor subunit alpha [Pseudomonadota bacterium]
MKRSNLTRKELAKAIHETMGFSQRGAGELVDSVFSKLKQKLLNEESVKLVHFGTFNVRNKSSRTGRNPRTGEAMEITKRSMVTFKPCKGLRKKINNEKKP